MHCLLSLKVTFGLCYDVCTIQAGYNKPFAHLQKKILEGKVVEILLQLVFTVQLW